MKPHYKAPEGFEAFAHFTAEHHLEEILRDGFIAKAESNIHAPSHDLEQVAQLPTAKARWDALLEPEGDPTRDPDRVVWLTKDFYASPKRQFWAWHPVHDAYGRQVGHILKTAYRFIVWLPEGEAVYWRDWMRQNDGTDWDWYEYGLAGKDEAERLTSKNWYLLDRVIPQSEWAFIEDVRTGKILWKR